MDFRLVKIFPNGDVDVSNDSFKQIPLTIFKGKNDIVPSPRVLSTSIDSEFEEELKT
jgi:hypothetical protein